MAEQDERLDSQQRVLSQLPQIQGRVAKHDERLDSQVQRMTLHALQQQERKAPDSQQVLADLRGELRETYLRTCRSVQPIPWVDHTLSLQDLFMEPTLKRSTGSSLSQRQSDERSVGLADILQPLQPGTPPPRRVLVHGTPGSGKSTLCHRLLSGWAEGGEASSPDLGVGSSSRADAPSHASTRPHTGTRSTFRTLWRRLLPGTRSPTSTESPSQPPPVTPSPSESFGGARPRRNRVQARVGSSPIGGFAIVLFLMVRNLIVGDLSDNLLFLLLGESWRSRQEELRACLGENCQQVLILLDGFDEAVHPHKDLLANILGEREMRGCTVIVTSRPGFCLSRFDATFQLQGFDHQTRVRYINRFVEVVKGAADHPCTAVLVHHLESPGIIGHLCQTPLFLVLVCVLGSQEGSALPDTRTQLYEQFVSFLHRQAVQRHGFDSDYMSSLQQTLQRVALTLLTDNITEISLATIEQHSATQPSKPGPSTVKHDQPVTARADVTLRALCQVGFLIQNYKLKGLEEVASGSFIHQSFVDYFAAKGFITMSKEHRKAFIADHVSRRTMFHNVFVYVAGCCGMEVLVELFDGWRRAVAARGALCFDPSDPVSEMSRMYDLTRDNHALLHDAPLSWLAESTDVCSASLALLTHCRLEAVCLAHGCTESCVRGVRTLVKALSGLQAPPAAPTLHLGLYECKQLGAGVVLDVLKQVGLTYGAVDCVLLQAGWNGGAWTVRECESLAALPACTRLKVLYLSVCEWAALDALSVFFTPAHALQRLSVWCRRPPGRGDHSPHLTEFRRNVRCLSNIQRIMLGGWTGEVSAEAERDLKDWGAGRGVEVEVMHDLRDWGEGRGVKVEVKRDLRDSGEGREVEIKRDLRDSGEGREVEIKRDLRDSGEGREVEIKRDLRDSGEGREVEIKRDLRDSGEGREVEIKRDLRDSGEGREVEIKRDLRDSGEGREVEIKRDLRDSGEGREVEIKRDLGDSGEGREVEIKRDLRDSGAGREVEIKRDLRDSGEGREVEIKRDLRDSGEGREVEMEVHRGNRSSDLRGGTKGLKQHVDYYPATYQKVEYPLPKDLEQSFDIKSKVSICTKNISAITLAALGNDEGKLCKVVKIVAELADHRSSISHRTRSQPTKDYSSPPSREAAQSLDISSKEQHVEETVCKGDQLGDPSADKPQVDGCPKPTDSKQTIDPESEINIIDLKYTRKIGKIVLAILWNDKDTLTEVEKILLYMHELEDSLTEKQPLTISTSGLQRGDQPGDTTEDKQAHKPQVDDFPGSSENDGYPEPTLSEAHTFDLQCEISSLDQNMLRRVGNFIWATMDNNEDKLHQMASILKYSNNLKEGCVKEEVHHLLNWAKEENKTLAMLDRLFEEFNIKTDVCTLLDRMTSHQSATLVSPESSQNTAKSNGPQTGAQKEVSNGAVFAMEDLTGKISRIDGLTITCLREYLGYGDHLKVFVTLDEEKTTFAKVQGLVQSAAMEMGYKRKVIVTQEAPPEIDVELQADLESGTMIKANDTGMKATVAGFFHSNKFKGRVFAATVAHLFFGSDGDCTLIKLEPTGESGFYLGTAHTTCVNVGPGEGFKRTSDTAYNDFSWVEVFGEGQFSNTIQEPKENGGRSLHPIIGNLVPNGMSKGQHIYVCKRSRNGLPTCPTEGKISCLEYTRGEGKLNFFELTSLTGNALARHGDSGSLVTSRDPTESNCVNAYGMVVAVYTKTGDGLALPLSQQLKEALGEDADAEFL